MQLNNTQVSSSAVINTNVVQKRLDLEQAIKAKSSSQPEKIEQMQKFLNTLFDDQVDYEPWAHEIEIVQEQEQMTPGEGMSVKEVQICDMNIF